MLELCKSLVGIPFNCLSCPKVGYDLEVYAIMIQVTLFLMFIGLIPSLGIRTLECLSLKNVLYLSGTFCSGCGFWLKLYSILELICGTWTQRCIG